jgi:hypothetical protein
MMHCGGWLRAALSPARCDIAAMGERADVANGCSTRTGWFVSVRGDSPPSASHGKPPRPTCSSGTAGQGGHPEPGRRVVAGTGLRGRVASAGVLGAANAPGAAGAANAPGAANAIGAADAPGAAGALGVVDVDLSRRPTFWRSAETWQM